MIANEAVDSMLRRKERGLICKLDIEKAYNHIRWEFVYQVMERMGFGRRWQSWIKWCVSRRPSRSYLMALQRVSFGARGVCDRAIPSPFIFS